MRNGESLLLQPTIGLTIAGEGSTKWVLPIGFATFSSPVSEKIRDEQTRQNIRRWGKLQLVQEYSYCESAAVCRSPPPPSSCVQPHRR
ncbi:Uncharacterised protein [Serratia liquefaciens]|nr:Uncharacterised protein [Serratia liquefaciens]